MLLTGATAVLYFDSLRLGKCRDISLAVDREALPTTKQGDIDRTFISGLRDTKGSASLFFDSTDPAVEALLTRLFNDAGTLSGVELVFDTSTDDKVSASVALTNATISTSFGSATVCDVQFQFSGKPVTKYQLNPPVPPQPPSSVAKWMAYATENETYTQSPSVVLDSQGNTYAFIAGDNGANSEVTKFSPIGEIVWIRRVTSYVGQPQTGSFNGPDNRRINQGQTLHRVNNNNILLCIYDRSGQTSLILINSEGQVIYNRAYSLSNGQILRTLNRTSDRFIITTQSIGFNTAASVYIFDVATGACLNRFAFSNLGNQIPYQVSAAIERPDGNWAFYSRYNLAPYDRYFIEVNSTFTAVGRAVFHNGLPLSDVFCFRPDTDGYLVINNSGYVQHLDNQFNLVQSRRFAGWPTGIAYESNGNYLIWSTYVNWYQDIGGIPGWPNLLTLIRYNWNNDSVGFVTMAGMGNSAAAYVDSSLQRVSLSTTNLAAYRQVASLDFIQPASTNGLPIVASNPPGYSFSARTVINPSPRPTIEQPVYTQRQDAIGIVTQTLPVERASTFIVEAVTRPWQLVYTPT